MKNATSPHRFKPSFMGFLLSAVLLSTAVTFVACADLAGPDLDATADKQAAEPEVFVVVDQMPELMGGLESIQEQIQYPAIAKKAGIQGRVIVQFIVDAQGQVVEPTVIRGIGAGADEEALRVLKAATFRPGYQAGEAVNVRMSLPITFKLDGVAGTLTNAGAEGSFIFQKPQMSGAPKMDASGIYVVVEEMPVLEGGLLALQREMQYPAVAKAAGIEGRVIVQFVIDESGSVTNPQIIRGFGGGLNEEALRVVRTARFTPGKVGGQPVPVKMSLPLTFKLNPEASSFGVIKQRSGEGMTDAEKAFYGSEWHSYIKQLNYSTKDEATEVIIVLKPETTEAVRKKIRISFEQGTFPHPAGGTFKNVTVKFN